MHLLSWPWFQPLLCLRFNSFLSFNVRHKNDGESYCHFCAQSYSIYPGYSLYFFNKILFFGRFPEQVYAVADLFKFNDKHYLQTHQIKVEEEEVKYSSNENVQKVFQKDCKGSKGRACFQRYMPEMQRETGDKHKLSTKAWTRPVIAITTQPGEKN